MSGWIGVDLDGTLAFYNGFKGPKEIGPPVPKMLERVKKWLKEGREVRIFTARVSPQQSAEDLKTVRRAIDLWCMRHVGQLLPITCVKDFGMIELWDDRCVQVQPNTGELVQDFWRHAQ